MALAVTAFLNNYCNYVARGYLFSKAIDENVSGLKIILQLQKNVCLLASENGQWIFRTVSS